METPSFSVDLRGPSPEADCLDCLVALPVAVDRMRAAANDTEIPNSMIQRTLDAFTALESGPRQSALIVAAGSQDLLYRHIATLTVMDRYTVAYFTQVVRYFFMQLSGRGVRTLYILDNALRDDRLSALLKLFDVGGISTVTPRRDGKEWGSLSARIRERVTELGHVAYIEPDNEVHYVEEAKALSRQLECVATFRNRAPEDPGFVLLHLSG